MTKAPTDLASHFRWHGDAFTDGQLIDTISPSTGHTKENNTDLRKEPVWEPGTHPGSWLAVWVYSARAVRDATTLTAQENRAREVIEGQKAARVPRFIKTTADGPGRSGINWRLEPRLREDQQTRERVHARNDIDRGHPVRRASAIWGDTRAEAAQANADTFLYTNAAPQAAKFNQGLDGSEWSPTCWNTRPTTVGGLWSYRTDLQRPRPGLPGRRHSAALLQGRRLHP